MTERMEIAVEALKALLAKDFKNIGFSAYNNKHTNIADYLANESFVLADAMMEREKMIMNEKNSTQKDV